MSKIYEALQQYELAQTGTDESSLTVSEVHSCNRAVSPELTETLIGLYRTIFTIVPGPDGRIIQFFESNSDAGCSEFIRAFANVSSSVLKKSVLLLDSDPAESSDFNLYNQNSRTSWFEGLKNNFLNNKPMNLRGKNSLFICRLSMDSGVLPVDFDSWETEDFMGRLKQTFDLVLIDSWSVAKPPRPILFSSHVDGVVLVLEAGKTKWQIAEKLKRDIAAQGGQVLGAILNNRTYPIPNGLYKRL